MAFNTVPAVVAGNKITAEWGNDVSTAAGELQTMSSSGETGPDSAGPTSGTTPLTIDTATFADPGIAGRLHVWANALITKTVSTDRFTIDIQVAGATICASSEPNAGGATFVPLRASGSAAIAGGSASTIDVILTRASGTGTATVGSGTQCVLHWIFIPAP